MITTPCKILIPGAANTGVERSRGYYIPAPFPDTALYYLRNLAYFVALRLLSLSRRMLRHRLGMSVRRCLWQVWMVMLILLLPCTSCQTAEPTNNQELKTNQPALCHSPTAENYIKVLETSLNRRTYTLGSIAAFFLVLAVMAFIYANKQKRAKRTVLQNKDAFIARQIADYDEQILRMLLIRAGYEEIRQKLNTEFGLDDDDFGGNQSPFIT